MAKINLKSICFKLLFFVYAILILLNMPAFNIMQFSLAIVLLIANVLTALAIDKIKPTLYDKIFLALLIVQFFLMCFSAFSLQVLPAWDFGRIFGGAQDITSNGYLTYSLQYFLESNNNFFITVILAIYFKVACKVFPITALQAGLILNVFALIFGVLFFYLTIRKIYNSQKALYFAVSAFAFLPLYAYSPIFYTDTLSIPFVSLLLYFIACIIKDEKHRCLNYCAFAIVFALGYKIKPTVLFILFAFLIALVLFKEVKNHFKGLIVSGFVIVTLLFSYNIWLNSNAIIDLTTIDEHRLPPSHYILMGLSGKGGYDPYYHAKSAECEDVTEINAYAFEEIKSIFNNKEPSELLNHYINKVQYTWADGTYFANNKLAIDPVHNTFLHKIMLPGADYNYIYNLIVQSGHIIVLIGLLAHCLLRTKENIFDMILSISVVLLMLFLLAWETRSRYIFNYALIFLYMQSTFIYSVKEKLLQKKKLI